MVDNTGVIQQKTDIAHVNTALKRSRVVALLGPRQCGKTTLARQFVPAKSLNYFDPEDPQSLARLTEPDIALRPLTGRRTTARKSISSCSRTAAASASNASAQMCPC